MAARISKADFDEKVLKSKLPVIVDFYSDSCVACKKLAPVLIPCLTIPVSLIGTLAVMAALGFSINTLPLTAWVL